MLSKAFILLIRFYQYSLSPLLMPACRFTPTCSQYGIEALQKYGLFKGSFLLGKRILSCHPWGRHGHDPLPEEWPFKKTDKKTI